jgi:hypothetical protein
MNNNTPYALLISIAALLMVGVSFFFGGGASDTQVLAQLNAVKAQLSDLQHAGALSGPEISSPYLQWGGVNQWHSASSPSATTTSGVFCSVPVPYGTTTVAFATWRPDNLAFGANQTFDISTSSTVSGSSTPALLIAASLTSAQVWMQEASSTQIASPSQVLNATNQATGASNVFTLVSSPTAPLYLNFRVATATPGTFATYLAGNCQTEFTQL